MLRRVRNQGVGFESVNEIISSPVIGHLKTLQTELLRLEAQLKQEYGPRHPKIVQLNAEKQKLDDKIYSEVQNIISAFESEVSFLRNRERALQESLDQAKQSVAGRPARRSPSGRAAARRRVQPRPVPGAPRPLQEAHRAARDHRGWRRGDLDRARAERSQLPAAQADHGRGLHRLAGGGRPARPDRGEHAERSAQHPADRADARRVMPEPRAAGEVQARLLARALSDAQAALGVRRGGARGPCQSAVRQAGPAAAGRARDLVAAGRRQDQPGLEPGRIGGRLRPQDRDPRSGSAPPERAGRLEPALDRTGHRRAGDRRCHASRRCCTRIRRSPIST